MAASGTYSGPVYYAVDPACTCVYDRGMAVKKGAQGGSTAGIEMSKAKRRALARKRRQEERGWAAQSSTVTVRKMTADELESFRATGT